MISRLEIRRIWLLLAACALAACSETEVELPPLQRVTSALESGDGFGAELVLRQMLADGTSRDRLAAYMGEAELLQGQPVEARKWLGDGEFSKDTAGRGFHILGRLEMREGNLPAAGQAFDRAIGYIPEDPQLWVDIGRLRYRGGEQSMAVEAALKAVELDPGDPEALLFRGQLARDAEGMVAALPWFEQALERRPDRLDLLAEYAATLGEAGEAQDMLEIVRRMAELNPGYLRAYYLQAVVAARAGKYDLARKLLVRSGDFVKNSPAGNLLAGVIDLETGNYASAAQVFDRLYRQQPQNARVRELLARSLSMGGNHRELIARFGEGARMTSGSPYLQAVVARSHEALGQREQAAALIDLAAARETGNLVALRPAGNFETVSRRDARSGEDAMALVRNNIVNGRGNEAIRVAEQFRQRFAGSADALALAGDAQLAGRNVSKALQYYAQSARIRQSWPLARRRIVALRAAGRSTEAHSLLEKFVSGHPAALEPLMLLARAQYDRGNLPRAAVLLDHAILVGADRDPELLALRAVVALRLDDPELAEMLAQRAMEVQPTHPASLQALAMVGGDDLASVLIAKADNLDRSVQLARR
ncbi:tetratricopeptide repeat protein [Parerythrobacter aestuarii]|uniref:tetratricopeptide repeat protein n=1 Tax=Parerythrobacter aestuarii TaxID=3020909 RepID=UPI0024DEC353|nr:tetratricopeptide repeat protein [Parerythrobacter aestuarii]